MRGGWKLLRACESAVLPPGEGLGVQYKEVCASLLGLFPRGFRLWVFERTFVRSTRVGARTCVYLLDTWDYNSPDGAAAHRALVVVPERGRDSGGQETPICISKVVPVCRSSCLTRGRAQEPCVVVTSKWPCGHGRAGVVARAENQRKTDCWSTQEQTKYTFP